MLVDVGFEFQTVQMIRLLDIDAPELRHPTHEEGQKAKDFTTSWIAKNSPPEDKWPLIVITEKDDSFGRYLARVLNSKGECLNDMLIEKGLAKPYKR